VHLDAANLAFDFLPTKAFFAFDRLGLDRRALGESDRDEIGVAVAQRAVEVLRDEVLPFRRTEGDPTSGTLTGEWTDSYGGL